MLNFLRNIRPIVWCEWVHRGHDVKITDAGNFSQKELRDVHLHVHPQEPVQVYYCTRCKIIGRAA